MVVIEAVGRTESTLSCRNLEDRVPTQIRGMLDYSGWTALSWAIMHDWVNDYKHLLSEREGRDVGVARTVDVMLYPKSDTHGVLSSGALCMFPQRVRDSDYNNLRKLMIEGYLSGTDFSDNGIRLRIPDHDGANQLEGELRRYFAQRDRRNPRDVELTEAAVTNYCIENDLPVSAQISFVRELNSQELLNY